jgi:hypothetical protein
MLIALFTLLFLGSGGGADLLINFDEVKENAKTEITDEERRDQALDVFKAVESERKDFSKKLADHSEAIEEIFESHAASEAEADAIWNDMYSDLEEHHGQLLDKREELKTYVTESEWSAMFEPDSRE